MTSVFLWCDASAHDGRSGQLGDARLVLPDGDPAVDEGGVGQNDAQVEASVGELLEPLRPVEGRLVEVEGRHGVREAEGELDLAARAVRVVEVARVDVGVERKVLRTLGLKFGDAGLREAVKREVAHVLIAVEHADEVEANVLLHEAERGDEAFDLLA